MPAISPGVELPLPPETLGATRSRKSGGPQPENLTAFRCPWLVLLRFLGAYFLFPSGFFSAAVSWPFA